MNSELFEKLPPLRDVIDQHKLRARKSLGQNFLLDMNLTEKIARAAGKLTDVTVFEIGPGPGGLTRGLLTTNAKKIIAIEKDRRCMAALQNVIECSEGRLSVIEADALKMDVTEMADAPRAIVANLPYNIATILLISWLKKIQDFQSLTLMFQKEVALRIVAKVGDKAYGRLSVMTGWLAHAHIAFDVPARAFTPAPKVTSSIVCISPRAETSDIPFEFMEKVVATAFNQRRKMIRKSLKPLYEDTETWLAKADVKQTVRAEEIDVAGFERLCRALQELAD